MSTPTWYDVLGVDRDATTDDIRDAWKRGVADLDPTDRRFRSLSDAAAVLLDEQRRTEYDATLPVDEETVPEPAPEPDEGSSGSGSAEGILPTTTAQSAEEDLRGAGPTPSSDSGTASTKASSRSPRVPFVAGWVLIVLAVVAAACLAVAGLSMSKAGPVQALSTVTVANDNSSVAVSGQDAGKTVTYNHTMLVESDGAAALAAAKTAIVPVLSYDYRHMAQAKTRAEAYMTDSYKKVYEKFFAVVQANAPRTKTVVTCRPPLDAGIVGVSPGVVQVLLFVDRPTTNVTFKKPYPYQDQVTMTMEKVGSQWLVNGLRTTPAAK